jgi:two-component system LytT family sensor kinase
MTGIHIAANLIPSKYRNWRMNNRVRMIVDKEHLRFYSRVGLGYFLLAVFVDLATEKGTFAAFVLNELWQAIYIIAVNWFFYEYVTQQLSRQRLFRSLSYIGLQMVILSLGFYLWQRMGIALNIFTRFITFENAGKAMAALFGDGLFSLFFFGVIRHIYNYLRLKQDAQQLRIEKQEAELNFLKSQTNPHFLFNTLNNIYALAREKSDLAPESILKLSKILRYMLYDTTGKFIAVEQEIRVISDYIALERLRYDDSLSLTFNHNIADMNQALPPLLLIPLVENAFKHGVSETRTNPRIDIHLTIKDRQLTFIVQNSMDDPGDDSVIKENIGLSNLRRQLQLLFHEYELALAKQPSKFIAKLTINLASHV